MGKKNNVFFNLKKLNIHLWLNTITTAFMAYVAYETFYKTQIEPDLQSPNIFYTAGNHEFFQFFFNADHLRIYKQLELTNTGKKIGFFYTPEVWIVNSDSLTKYWHFSECFHSKSSLMLFRSYNIASDGIFGEEVRYETENTDEIKFNFREISKQLYNNNYFWFTNEKHTDLSLKYFRSENRKHAGLNQIIHSQNYNVLDEAITNEIHEYFDNLIIRGLDTGKYYFIERTFLTDQEPIRRIFTFNLEKDDIEILFSDQVYYEQGFGFNGQIQESPLLRINLNYNITSYDVNQVDSFLYMYGD